MAELPPPLSAVALRLAGQVGQTALDRVAGDSLALADLDQHIAAVRAELGECQSSGASRAQQAGLRAAGAPSFRRRGGAPRDGAPSRRDAPSRRGTATDAPLTCPDVPFASSARQPEPVVPLRLLLHYACGFIEAAVRSDWWPADSADATDWASIRLAAVCQLISQAEAASELHPDLRASA